MKKLILILAVSQFSLKASDKDDLYERGKIIEGLRYEFELFRDPLCNYSGVMKKRAKNRDRARRRELARARDRLASEAAASAAPVHPIQIS